MEAAARRPPYKAVSFEVRNHHHSESFTWLELIFIVEIAVRGHFLVSAWSWPGPVLFVFLGTARLDLYTLRSPSLGT